MSHVHVPNELKPRTIRQRINDWLNETTTRKAVLPAYLILALGSVLGVVRLDNLNEQRTDDAIAQQAVDDYKTCATRIDTRDALREIFLSITALFEGNPGALAINEEIALNYPPLDLLTECGPDPRAHNTEGAS